MKKHASGIFTEFFRTRLEDIVTGVAMGFMHFKKQLVESGNITHFMKIQEQEDCIYFTFKIIIAFSFDKLEIMWYNISN